MAARIRIEVGRQRAAVLDMILEHPHIDAAEEDPVPYRATAIIDDHRLSAEAAARAIRRMPGIATAEPA
jgi:hypothetical protein